jgi:hypothetical protein
VGEEVDTETLGAYRGVINFKRATARGCMAEPI